jgi:hypothetical protein
MGLNVTINASIRESDISIWFLWNKTDLQLLAPIATTFKPEGHSAQDWEVREWNENETNRATKLLLQIVHFEQEISH